MTIQELYDSIPADMRDIPVMLDCHSSMPVNLRTALVCDWIGRGACFVLLVPEHKL